MVHFCLTLLILIRSNRSSTAWLCRGMLPGGHSKPGAQQTQTACIDRIGNTFCGAQTFIQGLRKRSIKAMPNITSKAAAGQASDFTGCLIATKTWLQYMIRTNENGLTIKQHSMTVKLQELQATVSARGSEQHVDERPMDRDAYHRAYVNAMSSIQARSAELLHAQVPVDEAAVMVPGVIKPRFKGLLVCEGLKLIRSHGVLIPKDVIVGGPGCALNS